MDGWIDFVIDFVFLLNLDLLLTLTAFYLIVVGLV